MPTASIALLIPASLIGFGWLLPNHYLPWLTAWGDGLTGVMLLALTGMVLWLKSSSFTLSWSLFLPAVISIAMVLFQLATGRIYFSGDALMATLYVALWLTSVATGRQITKLRFQGNVLNAITAGWVLFSVLSVGVAMVQWTGAFNLTIYMVDLPLGARPFGNVGQPNHLATICAIGLCSLLWLYEGRVVQRLGFWLGVGFLLFGMAMTQSRTGWLQVGLIVVAGAISRRSLKSRVSASQLGLVGGIFVAWVGVWPRLCDALLLSPGRTLLDQTSAGVRLPYWRAMLDAISREPWLGYGWQQVGAAQQRVALDHPPMSAHFEHSHNILLDLLLWNGIPIGIVIALLIAWWVTTCLRNIADAASVWLLALVGGILIHGLLEYPLEYAYFLIPLGLVMGVLDDSSSSKYQIHVSRRVAAPFVALLTAVFFSIAVEYLSIEEAHRTLRMESARIGASGITTPIQPRLVLNQLEAFQTFASTEATPSMTADQLEWMRKVSERFGYPPVLFRYALAAGLKGQPDAAQDTLQRICQIHEKERCTEAQSGWKALQVRYPQLLKIPSPHEAPGSK
ncbi:PglL family O-oligosaccharyltransferase [Rhodoferax antarcticus]|uniref:PglL family O-oligosaccharyltransferase n=1 Tax=Rhodoferax antarcticus TaxID=81479 RepID=UPI0022251D20|nr:Wzy polymerase domain-containing protein [Rhodoferax antarcticus]MCW2313845.1 O-antigen ligase [Rhodoferax antarcticus]